MQTTTRSVISKFSLLALCAATFATAMPAAASHTIDDLFIVEGRMHKVDEETGTWSLIGPTTWTGPTLLANDDANLYLVENSRLYKIAKNTGTHAQLGSAVWGGAQAMTFATYLPPNQPGIPIGIPRLYVVSDEELHRVDQTANGSWTVLGSLGAWPDTTSMTGYGTDLYIVSGARLYKASAQDGAHTMLGNSDWNGPTHMTFLGGYLYVIQNDRLHRVNPANGTYQVLGGPAWTNTRALTSIGPDNHLFAIDGDYLHRIDPANGNWQVIGGPAWTGQYTSMTSAWVIPLH